MLAGVTFLCIAESFLFPIHGMAHARNVPTGAVWDRAAGDVPLRVGEYAYAMIPVAGGGGVLACARIAQVPAQASPGGNSASWTLLAGFWAGGKSDEEVALQRIADRGDLDPTFFGGGQDATTHAKLCKLIDLAAERLKVLDDTAQDYVRG